MTDCTPRAENGAQPPYTHSIVLSAVSKLLKYNRHLNYYTARYTTSGDGGDIPQKNACFTKTRSLDQAALKCTNKYHSFPQNAGKSDADVPTSKPVLQRFLFCN